jgi:hypothetical protein
MIRESSFKSWFKFYGVFILIVLITVGWGVFFYYVSPTTLVTKIGIDNSYLVAFFVAVICGFSSVTGTTFYVTIGALSNGGASPLLLGIIGGIGVCISDTAFYFLVSKGTHIINKHFIKFSNFIKKWVKIVPSFVVNIGVFIYSAFIPIPNDVLLVTLSLSRVPFKKVAPYLFAGDIVSTLLIAYLLK